MFLGRYLADSQPQRRWAGAVHIPVHHRALALALVQNWASPDPRQIIIPLSTGKKGMKASEYKKIWGLSHSFTRTSTWLSVIGNCRFWRFLVDFRHFRVLHSTMATSHCCFLS